MDLSKQPIARMETLIVDRLRLAFAASSFGIARVPYPMSQTRFISLVQNMPVIGLAWRGMKADATSDRGLKGTMRWRLILLRDAASGLEAGFKGDATSLGLDAMLDVSMALLHGWTLPDVGRCTVTRAKGRLRFGTSNDAIVASRLDFEIRFTAPVAEYDLITLSDFKQMAVTWSLESGTSSITNTISQETP